MGSYRWNADHMLYLVHCEWSRWSLVSVVDYLVENEFGLQCVVDSKLVCNRVGEVVAMETKGVEVVAMEVEGVECYHQTFEGLVCCEWSHVSFEERGLVRDSFGHQCAGLEGGE